MTGEPDRPTVGVRFGYGCLAGLGFSALFWLLLALLIIKIWRNG